MFVAEERALESPAERPSRLGALEDELAELTGVVNSAHGRMVELVARALDEGLWAQEGLHTPVHWLCWKLGCSAGHARRPVRLAERARELPETTAALAAGEVSLDQASVVARHVPAEYDGSALTLARQATVSQLARTFRRYRFDASADGADRPERREVATWKDDDQWHLRAELPLDEGAVVERALHAAHHDLFHAAWCRSVLRPRTSSPIRAGHLDPGSPGCTSTRRCRTRCAD